MLWCIQNQRASTYSVCIGECAGCIDKSCLWLYTHFLALFHCFAAISLCHDRSFFIHPSEMHIVFCSIGRAPLLHGLGGRGAIALCLLAQFAFGLTVCIQRHFSGRNADACLMVFRLCANVGRCPTLGKCEVE